MTTPDGRHQEDGQVPVPVMPPPWIYLGRRGDSFAWMAPLGSPAR